jgi:hypothetical protein
MVPGGNAMQALNPDEGPNNEYFFGEGWPSFYPINLPIF